MERKERSHYFSMAEQELILEGYEQERHVLLRKSNTARSAKLRVEAWQRIAEKLNAVSGSGYRRTWQQVKTKHKNILQTANRKKTGEVKNTEETVTMILTSSEDQNNTDSLKVESISGGTCSESESQCGGAYISVEGHSVILLPPLKSEPEEEYSNCDEVFSNDNHLDEDLDHSSTQEKTIPLESVTVVQVPTEDIKTLYRRYLKKEMENRDHEMAYRALKMRKLEKEIQLLDKQLDTE